MNLDVSAMHGLTPDIDITQQMWAYVYITPSPRLACLLYLLVLIHQIHIAIYMSAKTSLFHLLSYTIYIMQPQPKPYRNPSTSPEGKQSHMATVGTGNWYPYLPIMNQTRAITFNLIMVYYDTNGSTNCRGIGSGWHVPVSHGPPSLQSRYPEPPEARPTGRPYAFLFILCRKQRLATQ